MSAYIYTIHDVYVGSTKNLNKRLDSHKTAFTNPNARDYNKKLYQYIRENGLEIVMNVIDMCPIDEQYIREQTWMDKLQLECNKNRAYRTPEQIKEQVNQYYIDNIEERKASHRQHYIDNREKISARKAIKVTCECGSICRRGDIARHLKSKKHLKRISDLISKTA